ncbi:hypothetical protein, partial [Rhizobium johnstonii]|uniref:hypothetical protein n=1 Tax=Rhizobium johnstonii TaxID=3019933 RepID=UPI003F963EB0
MAWLRVSHEQPPMPTRPRRPRDRAHKLGAYRLEISIGRKAEIGAGFKDLGAHVDHGCGCVAI